VASTRIDVFPGMSSLSDQHPAFLEAAAELDAMLREDPEVPARPASAAGPGAGAAGKGALLAAAVDLGGSATATTAFVRIVRLWLQRDRRRSIVLRRTLPDGTTLEREISGEGISDQTLRAALESIDQAD
jgi:Effector Associated Constant Component 1